jgi:hypothetical protein
MRAWIAGAVDARLAEAPSRVDHDALRTAQVRADRRVEAFGDFLAPSDAFEALVEDLAQEGLFRAGDVEELIRALDEEAHAIRAKPRVDERALNAELPANEFERLAHALHRDAVDAVHRGQHEGLDQVREGERQWRPLGRGEQRGVLAIADRPEPHRRGRKTDDLRRSHRGVRGQLFGRLSATDVRSFGHLPSVTIGIILRRLDGGRAARSTSHAVRMRA